ncbi:MAG: hypothetical protein JNK21_08525 [Rhodospirillaceae bacterium]|nr:hypothetical protein [Rhodospirillaceae bacterium]
MHYHLHLITGFTRKTMERFLSAHVNDDVIIGDSLTDENTAERQAVVLAFMSRQDRDTIQSLLGVRGHRLAPRSLRIERFSAVA